MRRQHPDRNLFWYSFVSPCFLIVGAVALMVWVRFCVAPSASSACAPESAPRGEPVSFDVDVAGDIRLNVEIERSGDRTRACATVTGVQKPFVQCRTFETGDPGGADPVEGSVGSAAVSGVRDEHADSAAPDRKSGAVADQAGP